MRNFEIGQRVIVKAVTSLEYDEKLQRYARRSEIAPVDAVVTGRTVRYLGKYCRSRGGAYGLDVEDYEPASLAVSGSIELWCVRFGMLNKEHWVADGDLEPGSIRLGTPGCYMKLPRRAPRLTYVASPESPVTIEPGEIKLLTFKEPALLT